MKDKNKDNIDDKIDYDKEKELKVAKSKREFKLIMLFAAPVVIGFSTFCYFFISSLEKGSV